MGEENLRWGAVKYEIATWNYYDGAEKNMMDGSGLHYIWSGRDGIERGKIQKTQMSFEEECN